MKDAGSALMGIGRASGENRAVQAAQQAIESPLLEVSIDGARGVLFNIIGGNDLSMHEINSAAELITSAADPEANIIFGATINPDLDGEVIITVVATGFDASYFSRRVISDNESNKNYREKDNSGDGIPPTADRPTDSDMADIDMSLDRKNEDEEDFKSDHPIANIWNLDNGDEENEKEEVEDSSENVNTIDEEEVEKPSFLRRLKRHDKNDKANKDDN
jgi:cell division protein FtsZ